MWLVRLLRYLSGSVRFSASGGFPERFINLCTQNGIPLWALKRERDLLLGTTTIRGYKRIRQSARRSGVRLRIQKKSGLPFAVHRQKKRAGLVIGLLTAGLVVSFLSARLWTVRVEGNVRLSDERILAVFSELGVQVGASRAGLDAREIADEAIRRFDGTLSWAAVNIDGSGAVIEVRESIPAPEITDTSMPCNIVSGEDGVITKLQLYAGQEEVEVGSAVVKGDLLISGVRVNRDGSETLGHADGRVYARVAETVVGDSRNIELLTDGEEKRRYSLYFFGLEIPFRRMPGAENYYRVASYLSDGSTALPLGWIRERSFVPVPAQGVPDETQSRLLAAGRFSDGYRALCRKGVVLSADRSFEGGIYRGIYMCEQQVGIKKQIFIEKD